MKTRIIGAIVALILAAVGAFVLVTYVRGADARAAEGAELADVYIVQEAIPEGTPASQSASSSSSIPFPSATSPRVRSPTSDRASTGLVADAELLPGEQLLSARFIDPAELAARGDVPVPDRACRSSPSRCRLTASSAARCERATASDSSARWTPMRSAITRT